jgi:succinate dehydrogenase / fumarate reductase membrane anchor subunit
MTYLTDRKRAVGAGASHTGTAHHWFMTMSSVALAVMLPVWLYLFGAAIGGTRDQVVAAFANPFTAILTALVLVVSMRHFAKGSAVMVEDYAHGTARKAGLIFVSALAAVIATTGLYALIRIAL